MDERAAVFADQTFGKVNQLIHTIAEADERGLALSVAAFAEDVLGQLLMAYLLGGPVKKALVEGFNAPLGTLSARIKACYAVGMLSTLQFRDLEYIRKIRNAFAHSWDGCSFERSDIKAWIASMEQSRLGVSPSTDSKQKFVSASECILVELQYLLSQVGREKPRGQVKIVASHFATKPHSPNDPPVSYVRSLSLKTAD